MSNTDRLSEISDYIDQIEGAATTGRKNGDGDYLRQMRRERDEARAMLNRAGQDNYDLAGELDEARAEIGRLRFALAEIMYDHTDWSQEAERNMERLRMIAERALAGDKP